MDRWRGKVALVTGASTGIGRAITLELLRQGMKVIGCARDVDRIREIGEKEDASVGGSLTAIRCDLTKEDEILEMFEKIRRREGQIDVCVNNAGLSFECPLLSGATGEWTTMLSVNVLALCICTREAVKLMRENNIESGQIINISSMSAHRVPDMTSYLYMATKHMVKALTEGVRRELRANNSSIRVASISSGLVETEFEYRCFYDDPDMARSIYESIHCMQPKDIAQSVLYILRQPERVDVHDILLRPTEQAV